MKYKIYHNPRCSKSRQTLAILEETGVKFEIIDYLKEPISVSELKEVIHKLGITPDALIRKNEAIFKEQYKGKELANNEWLDVMINHPKLMERPIVTNDEKAIIGRPPENVLDLIQTS